MVQISFTRDQHGFWKQQKPQPMVYTQEYKQRQQTTERMSWLRLGCLLTVLNKNIIQLADWKICDVGSGNGIFIRQAKAVFDYAYNYDLCGDTITKQQLYNTMWDVIFLTDVLQHFVSVQQLLKIPYKYLFLSFPQCPQTENWEDLRSWKHFKPDEHLYMLTGKGVKAWLTKNNHQLLYQGNIQDTIRKSQLPVNITTQIYKRCKL